MYGIKQHIRLIAEREDIFVFPGPYLRPAGNRALSRMAPVFVIADHPPQHTMVCGNDAVVAVAQMRY